VALPALVGLNWVSTSATLVGYAIDADATGNGFAPVPAAVDGSLPGIRLYHCAWVQRGEAKLVPERLTFVAPGPLSNRTLFRKVSGPPALVVSPGRPPAASVGLPLTIAHDWSIVALSFNWMPLVKNLAKIVLAILPFVPRRRSAPLPPLADASF